MTLRKLVLFQTSLLALFAASTSMAGEIPSIVKCITHTSSNLVLDATKLTAKITPVGAQTTTIAIVNIQTEELEVFPPVLLTTYQLEDGRSIQTEFSGDNTQGTGRFIRVNGEYSPNFRGCVR